MEERERQVLKHGARVVAWKLPFGGRFAMLVLVGGADRPTPHASRLLRRATRCFSEASPDSARRGSAVAARSSAVSSRSQAAVAAAIALACCRLPCRSGVAVCEDSARTAATASRVISASPASGRAGCSLASGGATPWQSPVAFASCYHRPGALLSPATTRRCGQCFSRSRPTSARYSARWKRPNAI